MSPQANDADAYALVSVLLPRPESAGGGDGVLSCDGGGGGWVACGCCGCGAEVGVPPTPAISMGILPNGFL